jgi:hypothetical protein
MRADGTRADGVVLSAPATAAAPEPALQPAE